MKKRIIAIILTLVTVFCSMPFVTASAKSGYVKRTTSELGVNFIEAFEGYYQYAYWDYEHYTIGYGTTCGKDEYPSGISQQKAHELLKKVLPSYEAGLNSFLKKNDIYVNQNQYDALISFTYNFGAYVWTGQVTLGEYLIDGIEKYSDKQIANAFGLWNKAGGQVSQGLVERRAAEARLFCTDNYSAQKELYVISDAINVRKSASASSGIVTSLKRGDIIAVESKIYTNTHTWGYTTIGSKSGWVALDYAKYAHVETATTKFISTCLYNATNVESGIKLYWKKVNGATGYKIYRRSESDSKAKVIKTITDAKTVSFTDTNVSKKNYKYYVVSYKKTSSGVKYAQRSGIVSINYYPAPEIVSLTPAKTGLKLTWKKLSGTNGYRVLRRTADDVYTTIATLDNKTTSYLDTTAVGGVKYYYTVKGFTSKALGAAPAGKGGMYLAAPTAKSSSNTSSSITINWTSTKGAGGYYLYRKAYGDKSYQKIATVSGTSYTDKSVSTEKGYYYAVKAYKSSIVSCLSNYLYAKIYTPPIPTAKSGNDGITLNWNDVSGADSYCVYRRAETDKTYSKIAQVKESSYTDASASPGVKYYYKISVIDSNHQSYQGKSGSATFFASTSFTSATATTNGIKLKWKAVKNAKSYSIYKYGNNKYTLIKTVTGTTFTDTTLGKLTSRHYAIKVNYSSGKSNYSEKFTGYKLATPKLTVKSTGKSIRLTWTKDENATGVIIYRKKYGEKSYTLYTKEEVFSGNTYENTKVSKGKTYYYRIKFIRGNNTSLSSNTAKATV